MEGPCCDNLPQMADERPPGGALDERQERFIEQTPFFLTEQRGAGQVHFTDHSLLVE